MQEIIDLAKRSADEAEVYVVTTDETPVTFEANRLKSLETKQSVSVSLRLVRNGRIGFASATGLGSPEALVDMALETAEFGAAARFVLPAARDYADIEVYDPDMERLSIEDMVDFGRSLIEAVRGHTPELVCEAGVTKGTVTVDIVNSRGGQSSYRKSFCHAGMEGTLVRDTDMLFVGEIESSCHPLRESGPLAESVIHQLDLAKRTAAVTTGRLPVILTPKGVRGVLLPPLAAAFNGKLVLQQASPLVGRQGERIFDERVSVWDDATINYRPSSRPCDDEGVPSRKTPLVLRGAVQGFLYDLQTAGQAGVESTGSASRGRGSMPAPSMSALVFEEGDSSFRDMVADVKAGLVVETLIGAGQGNILGGDFGGNVLLGYKVENGEIVGRVKDTMVSGNVYDVMNEVVAIGDESVWVGHPLKAPALYLANVSVATKV